MNSRRGKIKVQRSGLEEVIKGLTDIVNKDMIRREYTLVTPKGNQLKISFDTNIMEAITRINKVLNLEGSSTRPRLPAQRPKPVQYDLPLLAIA